MSIFQMCMKCNYICCPCSATIHLRETKFPTQIDSYISCQSLRKNDLQETLMYIRLYQISQCLIHLTLVEDAHSAFYRETVLFMYTPFGLSGETSYFQTSLHPPRDSLGNLIKEYIYIYSNNMITYTYLQSSYHGTR